MFIWTIDKFLHPEHAAKVFESFYFIGGLGSSAFYIIGLIELVIIVGFLAGYKKRLTYGAVLILHGISTISTVKQYLTPFEGPNLLFFAAWPMLAACFVLYYLRDLDTLLAVEKD
jgi:hypothetical protein